MEVQKNSLGDEAGALAKAQINDDLLRAPPMSNLKEKPNFNTTITSEK